MNQIKDFIEYLINAIKFWVIIQPWESGIRVRAGKNIKKLSGGLWFKIPYLDSIFAQESRLRVISLAMQTLTSKDLKTITLNSAIGYQITDIELLYTKLYHPELTLSNMAMSEVSDFVYKNNLEDIDPHIIEKAVLDKLQSENYGIKVEYFRLMNFAVVRTYRLIQDQSWFNEGVRLDQKKV